MTGGRGWGGVGVCAAVGLALTASSPAPPVVEQSWEWGLPPDIRAPRVPDDNPMTPAKVELGRHLFYDERLSANGTQSCATCHQQELAFTDGLGRAVGSTGEVHPRGSMSLTNVAYSSALAWADPDLHSLEEQQRGPLFGTSPVEMGMSGREAELIARLRASEVYPTLFSEAYPSDDDPITLEHVLQSIATFERAMISFDSPYDRRVLWKDGTRASAEVILGEELFFAERTGCADCHDAPHFTNSVDFEGATRVLREFFNTGLYDIDGSGAYPEPNTGAHAITGDPDHMGQFRAPTLRNIAVTAPYMHDGSIETLEDVIRDHYQLGGRSRSQRTSPLMVRFGMSDTEVEALIAFLETLTDESFLTDPALGDPWPARTAR